MTNRFAIAGWSLVPGRAEIRFQYRCDRYGDFEEALVFPVEPDSLGSLSARQSALIDLIAMALGVSYYKAAACGEIALPSALTQEGLALARALYVEGLGEFYVQNTIAYPPDVRFTEANGQPLVARPPALAESRAAHAGASTAIAAFGGGKDSHVAFSLIERAGAQASLVSVALSDKVAARIRECTTRPVEIITRRIDQRLIEANRAGALNGHIPITAINSLILTLYASFKSADWVVFANERSADEATVTINGHGINHQFSKTLQAERLLSGAIQSVLPTGPLYFSALRPVSELWIARALVGLPDALQTFCSCNRDFSFIRASTPQLTSHWCGRCAKCVFTIIITAPFMSRAQSVALFGADALDTADSIAHARDMAGLSESKPWDCVGTIDEVAAALSFLLDKPDWRDALVVREIGPLLREKLGAAALKEKFAEALTIKGASLAPPDFAFLLEQQDA